jgi:RNA recognition motif-containing protein
LVVKNLPRTLTSEQLRKHFSAQGDVTDARILFTGDGRSRQFGFVGYRTEAEASRARKFFDKSYINTSRLTVEIAMQVCFGGLRYKPCSSPSHTLSLSFSPTLLQLSLQLFNSLSPTLQLSLSNS